jgi:glyoxylase-like metal-dependent hydrolase (beta-lactamase superfamily II)
MSQKARIRLGNLDLIVLSDGYFWADAGSLFGIVPKVLWGPIVGDKLDDLNRVRMPLNSLLLRSNGKLVLVETGVGNKPGQRRFASPPEEGTLLSALTAAGVQPEEIDIVVNSHLHFDHCGWNTVMDGDTPVPLFPRARYYVQRAEYEAFMHPNERTRATYFQENLAPVMASGQLELVDGELALTDEVRFVPTPGHSDGHASLFVHSAGETLLYTGDMAQHVAHLERIPWQSAWDIMQIVAMETKKRVTEQAIRDGSLILLTHGEFPGLGRLVLTEDNRRKWVPVPALTG